MRALNLRTPPAVLGSKVTRIQAAQALLLKAFIPKTNIAIGATESLTYCTVRVTYSHRGAKITRPKITHPSYHKMLYESRT
jgi:hypothetical protein